MSFDIDTITEPQVDPVKTALERLAADGYGRDGFDEAGARDGYQRPLVKDPSDLDARPKPMQRPSTRAKALDDMQGLIRWKAGMAARGAALYPDIAAKLADVDMSDPNEKKFLYNEADKLAQLAGSSEGADYGSLVHALIEAWIAGAAWRAYLDGLDIAEMLIQAVESVQEALDRAGIEIIESEVCIVNETHGVAGSTDGLGRRKVEGRSKIFDVKTTKPQSLNDSWLSFLVQTRLYSTGECLYDPFTGHRRSYPEDFDRDSAWIIHVDWRRGVTTIYDLNLADIDQAIELANKVVEWRARAGEYVTVTQPAEDLLALMEQSIELANIERGKVTEASVRAAEVDAEMEAVLAETEGNWEQLKTKAEERIREESPAPAPTTPAQDGFLDVARRLSVARNGGQEDKLDFTRARVDDLIEAGHSDLVIENWKTYGLPGIGEKYIRTHGSPTSEQMKAIDDVLTAIEKGVGRWVSDDEVAEIKALYQALSDDAKKRFQEWLKATGWSGAHRFTKKRALILNATLQDLARSRA